MNDASDAEMPVQQQRSAEADTDGPSLLGRLLRLLVGLTLSVLLGIGLGVLGFAGLPWLYRGFTEPAQFNATRIAQQAAELQDLRATLDQVQAQDQTRLVELEASLATQTAELAAQHDQVAQLETALQESQRSLNGLSASRERLTRLESGLGELAEQVQALQTLLEQGGGPLDQLQRNMLMSQASLHMLRARLWLIENNAGLAAEEVRAARGMLAQAAANWPAAEQQALQGVLQRLDLTLEDLQLRPLIAADDLEIAWQLLAQLMGAQQQLPE